jgi:hypothetical protein
MSVLENDGKQVQARGSKKQLDKSAVNAKAIRRPIASYSAIGLANKMLCPQKLQP